ncbi:hypothetical protein [Streptomyces sp. NPDC055287]
MPRYSATRRLPSYGSRRAWTEWGTQEEVLQYVKQLWQVLVRYGGELGDA